MKALNTTTFLFVAAVLLLPIDQRALAGQTSALDPYADIQPGSKPKVKHSSKPDEHVKTKAPKKAAPEESAYTNERDLEPAPVKEERAPQVHTPKAAKAPKPVSPKPVAEKPAPTPKGGKSTDLTEKNEGEKAVEKAEKTSAPKSVHSEDEGVGSGLREIGQGYVKTFKAAGGSFASGAKAVGAKIAAGSKIAGEKLSNGAKASGGYISKGAHGIKDGAGSMGEKVKAGADAVSDKVKPSKVAKAPKEPKEKPSEQVAEKRAPKEKPIKEVAQKPEKQAKVHKAKQPKAIAEKPSEQALDQAGVTSPPAGVPDFASIGKPLPPVEPLKQHHTGPGVISKTVGKFNFNPFGGKKTKTAKASELKVQAPRQAAVDIGHPQATE